MLGDLLRLVVQGTGFKLHIKGMGLSHTINIYSASFRFTVENEIENCIIHLRLFVVISTLLHFETTFSCFAILEERGRGYRQQVKFFFLNKYSILAYQQTETVILLIKAILLAMLDCLTVL